MIMRIIVLGALLLLLVKGYKSVEKQFAYVADVTRTGVTKAELNKIRGLILTDLLACNGCRFPIMDDRPFSSCSGTVPSASKHEYFDESHRFRQP
jgi:hypothetical protein